jgi:hypothetical protein
MKVRTSVSVSDGIWLLLIVAIIITTATTQQDRKKEARYNASVAKTNIEKAKKNTDPYSCSGATMEIVALTDKKPVTVVLGEVREGRYENRYRGDVTEVWRVDTPKPQKIGEALSPRNPICLGSKY